MYVCVIMYTYMYVHVAALIPLWTQYIQTLGVAPNCKAKAANFNVNIHV